MHNPNEIWHAEVNGESYETTFGELTVWIADNSLLETDRVRRGNLRWLEAGRVPLLRDFFNAKAEGTEPPFVQVSTTGGEIPANEGTDNINAQIESLHNISANQVYQNTVDAGQNGDRLEPQESLVVEEILPDIDNCNIHAELPSKYICESCSHAFCRECPQSYGSKVKICPYCGAMCREIEEYQAVRREESQFRRDVSVGFGFADFGAALKYPFQFKTSLFFGGLFYAIFGIGQKAGVMGSIFLIVGALFCLMLANALTFGVLANTMDNFSRGLTDRNFMPSFDDFSLWDDVLHPFFLSVAVWLSSFGILFLLVAGLVWYSWNSFVSQASQSPNSTEIGMTESQATQKHVADLLEKYKSQNRARTDLTVGEDGLTAGQRENLDEEAEFQRLNDMANNYRQAQLESAFGKMPEKLEQERRSFITQFIKVAGVFILLAGLALCWGLFYFPAACLVAGYTRSFMATLNPLVGLDTIKHLGLDYVKILLMCFLMSVMSGFIGIILGFVFGPFDLPTFGNLPAQFIGSFVTFYFAVAFAVTLGFAIYKNAESLKLYHAQ